jgi:NAD-reducing hydrogenase small subunit
MSLPKLATIWLDGCSGCHMSLLDVDERLLQLTAMADLVYSPLVDNKVYPSDVDVVFVEGAVSTDEDLERVTMVRARSRILVAFGDCAVTTNVPGMRNTFGGDAGQPLYQRAYVDNVTFVPGIPAVIPSERLPHHLPKTLAVHKVVDVDVFLPGCPPSADIIFDTLVALLEGRPPVAAAHARFGK